LPTGQMSGARTHLSESRYHVPLPLKVFIDFLRKRLLGRVRIFQAIRSPIYDNITLSGAINADPGAAIVMVDDADQGKVAVMPLFVAITPGMKLTFPGEGDSDGGGPKNPREAFKRTRQ
jgi:hypothetical protein